MPSTRTVNLLALQVIRLERVNTQYVEIEASDSSATLKFMSFASQAPQINSKLRVTVEEVDDA